MGIAAASIPTALMSGSAVPLAGLAVPFIQSPLMAGKVIKAAAKVGPFVGSMIRYSPGTLENYYMSPGIAK